MEKGKAIDKINKAIDVMIDIKEDGFACFKVGDIIDRLNDLRSNIEHGIIVSKKG
jgi:hypothetical protein